MKEWLTAKRSRIIICGILISALPLIALSLFVYFTVTDYVKDLLIEESRTLSRVAAARLEAGLDSAKSMMRLFVTRPLLVDAVRKRDPKEIERHLKMLLSSSERFERIFITTPRGALLADYPSDPAVRGRNFSDRDWYKGVTQSGDIYVSDFYMRAAKPARYLFAISIPVKDIQGSILGYLTVQPKEEFIGMFVRDLNMHGGLIYTVDKNGYLTYHPVFTLDRKIDMTGEPAVALALKGLRGVMAFEDREKGKRNIYAYGPVSGTGWGIVIKQKESDILAPANNIALALLIFTSLMIAVAGFISYKAAIQFSETKKLSDDLREEEQIEKTHVEMLALLNRPWTDETALGTAFLNKLEEIGCMNAGIMFVVEDDSVSACAAVMAKLPEHPDTLTLECILKMKPLQYQDVPSESYLVSDTAVAGRIMPRDIIAVPLMLKSEAVGAIELACIRGLSERNRRILGHIAPQLASTLASIRDNKKVREMAEEIAASNEELRVTNEELQVVNEEMQTQQAELHDANRRLADASKAKSDFLANMSHELRTPLNSIIGFSEILYDQVPGPLNESQREYAGIIRSSGKHLLSLINDILDLAKIEAGKEALSMSCFKLAELLTESLVLFREKALTHSIKLELDTDIPADLSIEADNRKLKQVLYNLLSNALKFTADGGTVMLSARQVGYGEAAERFPELASCDTDLAEISVSDTGIGIHEEDIPKLFLEFSQIESPYEKKFEGTGLGLALCRQLVSKHGGVIWVESEFGKGSRFSFLIPLRQCSDEAAEQESVHDDGTAESGKSILVIEDDRNSARLLGTVLSNRGHGVIIAHDGHEGIRKAAEQLPDLIILDMMLPGLNGFEVLETLRRDEKISNIPVIVLSATDFSEPEKTKFGTQVRHILRKGEVASRHFVEAVNGLMNNKSGG